MKRTIIYVVYLFFLWKNKMVVALNAAQSNLRLLAEGVNSENIEEHDIFDPQHIFPINWQIYFTLNNNETPPSSNGHPLHSDLGLLGLATSVRSFQSSEIDESDNLLPLSNGRFSPLITTPADVYCRLMKCAIVNAVNLELPNEVSLMEKIITWIVFKQPSEHEASLVRSVLHLARRENTNVYSLLLFNIISYKNSFVHISGDGTENVSVFKLGEGSPSIRITVLDAAVRKALESLRLFDYLLGSVDFFSEYLQRTLRYFILQAMHFNLLRGPLLDFLFVCYSSRKFAVFARNALVNRSNPELKILRLFMKLKFFMLLLQFLRHSGNQEIPRNADSLQNVLLKYFVTCEIKSLVSTIEYLIKPMIC